jgi:hypothetical protein
MIYFSQRKLFMLWAVSLPILLSLLGCGTSSSSDENLNSNRFIGEEGEVRYRVKIESLWTSSSHPTGPSFPSNPHFSPPVSVIHDGTKFFWKRGENATKGVESLAETGAVGTIFSEISSNLGKGVLNAESAGGFNASGGASFEISAKNGFSHYSFASMIAPSPDWFIGISNLNLQDDQGKWHSKIVCSLIGYDAGTETADAFTTGGSPTSPIETIHRLTDDSATKTQELSQFFGKITIELANDSDAIETSTASPSITNCVITNKVAANTNTKVVAKYSITFTNLWTSTSHPDGPAFPSDDHFSGAVSATHNGKHDFWKRGQEATSGLESLAEVGATSGFLNEINAKKNDGVFESKTSGFPASLSIDAHSDHTYYTFASMIAPSPDWFVGFSKFNLQNPQGKWYKKIECNLIGYDAGTESADTFTFSGTATNPKEMIHRLVDDDGAKTKKLSQPFAKVTITLDSTLDDSLVTTDTSTINCPS